MSHLFVVSEYSIFIYHVSSSLVRGHLNEDRKTSNKIKRKCQKMLWELYGKQIITKSSFCHFARSSNQFLIVINHAKFAFFGTVQTEGKLTKNVS